ncbi:rho guanine nucleotide exchange factor 1-like isoform X2 [Babylonia areolata]|uniref:rho guanine nucleotide exchange factor 1-like isoform X2 n=1 Tax=Babylonia areolata TaxID=304850 RepID=UPI003FD3D68F
MQHHDSDLEVEEVLPPQEQVPAEEVLPPQEQVLAEEVLPPQEQVPAEEVLPPLEQVPAEEVLPPLEQVPGEEVLPPLEQVLAEEVLPPLEQVLAEEVLPPLEQVPAEEVLPPLEQVPGEEVLPPQEQVLAEEVLPPQEQVPAEEVLPPQEQVPAEEVLPPQEQVLGEEVLPPQEQVPAEEVLPPQEQVPAEEVLPSQEQVPAEEVLPPQEQVPAEEVLPPQEQVPGEEVLPPQEQVLGEEVLPPQEQVPGEEVLPPQEQVPAEEVLPPQEQVSAEEVLPPQEQVPAEEVLPPQEQVLGEGVERLEAEERQRQEVINELFHTEKAHLRKLKVLDQLFKRPMLAEFGIIPDLARALFPKLDEVITMHESMIRAMEGRRSRSPVVADIGDILLDRFDGVHGDSFRKASAEYCRNHPFALDALKRCRLKDQRLGEFLAETETNPLCVRLELKDLVPCQAQRLVVYPVLIGRLLRHSKSSSTEDRRNVERALSCTRKIAAYVSQALTECQNFHRLKDMQKRLDTRTIDASANPELLDIKNLNLTEHKLVMEEPLRWRIRSSRLKEVQVVLLEDLLVLLQRVDDRLVLKFTSTDRQFCARYGFLYTHSPVLRLQNLLAREIATDKKGFFVINTSATRPQIYQLLAETEHASKT